MAKSTMKKSSSAKKGAKPKGVRVAKPARQPKSARQSIQSIKPGRTQKVKTTAPSRPSRTAKTRPAPQPAPAASNGIMETVTSDTKPRKNLAGLTTKELEHYRDLLLAKRRELVGDMSSMEREALRTGGGSNLSNLPIHMADMGTDNYEQEFTLGLMEKDRNVLREINVALAKIQNGTYGLCDGSGKPIGKPRLEAQPWARFSIEYARKMEKGMPRP